MTPRRTTIVPVLLALVAAAATAVPAAAHPAPQVKPKASFCASFLKDQHEFNSHPVPLTHDHGATFYKEQKSKNDFYVCDEKSKSSSGGQTVDGAKGFTVDTFAADPKGHAALAFVTMKGKPTYQGEPVTPLMVTLYHLAPHGRSDNVIVADLTGSIIKTSFSANGWSAWAEGDAVTGYDITVADTPNTTALDDPNYLPGGVSTTDPKGWSLEPQGKDVVLHYTDADGAAQTLLFPYKFTPPTQ